MAQFSAGSSALGYLFQATRGLELLLDFKGSAKLYVERFDDLEFEKDGSTRELIQLKHKVKSQVSLSNSSPDLWKSIRIWIEYYNSEKITLDDTFFAIMTTAKVSDNSAAFYLKDSKFRDVAKAKEILDDISNKSLSSENELSYEAYNSLSFDQAYKLLDHVRIIDSTPNIENTESELREKLSWAVRPAHIELFYERFLGWWFKSIIEHLSGDSKIPITFDETQTKIFDLAEQFRSDNLPIDYRDFVPSDTEILTAKQMIFVKQLELILISDKRIQKAIYDYYKAFNQRSRWVREKLLYSNSLDQYETELIDEFERYSDKLTRTISGLKEDKLIEIGQNIFYYIDTELPTISINNSVAIPYLMRGSYHMLTQERRIGWHPEFVKRLETLLPIGDQKHAKYEN